MAEKYKSIIVRQIGVNDDSAILVEWLHGNKAQVKKNDALCIIESTKSIFEISSTESGYLVTLVNEGETINVNQEIARIVFEEKSIRTILKKYKEIEKVDTTNIIITKKAEALAKKYQIDLTQFINVNQMIRTKDIEEIIKENNSKISDRVDLSIDKNKKPVVVYGAGKGGATIFETLDLYGEYEVVAFFDDNICGSFLGCPIYGISEQNILLNNNVERLIIAIANGKKRCLFGKELEKNGFEIINAIHPKSFISPRSKLGKGNHVKAGVVIDSNTTIGNHNIIDNAVSIAHDNSIGDGCHLAPGCVLGSSIEIDDYSVLGIGSSISTNVKIGKGCIVSLNTSVINDVNDNLLVEGVPGEVIGKTKI